MRRAVELGTELLLLVRQVDAPQLDAVLVEHSELGLWGGYPSIVEDEPELALLTAFGQRSGQRRQLASLLYAAQSVVPGHLDDQTVQLAGAGSQGRIENG